MIQLNKSRKQFKSLSKVSKARVLISEQGLSAGQANPSDWAARLAWGRSLAPGDRKTGQLNLLGDFSEQTGASFG
jgi:hypothetical protein